MYRKHLGAEAFANLPRSGLLEQGIGLDTSTIKLPVEISAEFVIITNEV